MATYKSEFLSHYYEGRARPRHAYSMGLIHWWARLASVAPGIANFFSQTPGLSAMAKWLGGLAPQRAMPAFAHQTFKDWFRTRPVRNQDKPPVILWADTFTNYFQPEHGKAAVEVLEDAGYQVRVPMAHLCCGRPLYDFGMLDTAKGLLRTILDTLRPEIEAGVPLVGLEPSCLTVFRDELIGLFPENEDAKRLCGQSFVLSEFLNKQVKGYQPPKINRKALVHIHCHHKSVLKQNDEFELLDKMGIAAEVPEAGCCGLAGSFGFEDGHYDISMAIGEQHLLPAVRQSDPDTLLIANGFSCETQIFQGTGRRPMHIAEVIRDGIRRFKPHKDAAVVTHRPMPTLVARQPLVAVGVAALLGVGVGYLVTSRRRS